jgi:hypothetical protein
MTPSGGACIGSRFVQRTALLEAVLMAVLVTVLLGCELAADAVATGVAMASAVPMAMTATLDRRVSVKRLADMAKSCSSGPGDGPAPIFPRLHELRNGGIRFTRFIRRLAVPAAGS